MIKGGVKTVTGPFVFWQEVNMGFARGDVLEHKKQDIFMLLHWPYRAVSVRVYAAITETCAATTRQPSGVRMETWLCRPIFPGSDGRRNMVQAVAISRP